MRSFPTAMVTRAVLVYIILCVFSVQASLISVGLNIDPANPLGNPGTDQTSALGVQWVRIEYKDSGTQPTQFGFYDPIISSYYTHGDWNEYITSFSARCSAVAQHYSTQVDAYEIWNEEDLVATAVPEEYYASLLRNAYNAIKAVSGGAKVIVGGLASGQPSYVSNVMQANGGQLYADAIGIHPYGQRPYPDWPNPTWGFGNLIDLLNAYLTITPSVPLWITEIGTDDTTVQDQFPFMAFSSVNTSMPYQAPVVIWYCWSDGMGVPWGLVDTNGNPKGSYISYQKFTRA